ncbi:MAG: tRNA (adenosine(37)-N6)-dimethylallyltransferase MiaA [Clostridia bacterium]|nr:tRNA (adenosine(37)-N6)-dimethylallyltransferase MiaA [Clostridia bacterium]
MEKDLIPVISIVGPTASGKTELATDLALKFGGEIVSADSMQVYKEFEISTAKPNLAQRSKVKHHLIDILHVNEEFSVAQYKELAKEAVINIHARGKLPFLVGGTGLYIDSFLKNIEFEIKNTSDEKIRKELSEKSNLELFEILKKIDPKSAQNIHINNKKRIIRAIEFFYTSGYPISIQVKNSQNRVSPFKVCKIGLNFKNREILYSRINVRVEKMFKLGLVKEVKNISDNMTLSKTAEAAIGYKEILEYTNGKTDLDSAKENLKKVTRNYAKRQITWFKRDPEINWIYPDNMENYNEILISAEEIIKKFTN